MKKLIILMGAALTVMAPSGICQSGTVKGFVYESATGQAVPMASVVLEGSKTGTTSGSDGFFLLTRVPAGVHTVVVSYLGFVDYRKQITVEAGHASQLVVHLNPKVFELDAATISAERQRSERINSVSAHHLTRITLNRVPGLTGQADLAEYLQVLPGVIFTGDRGGQFYVRGGAPVQNLVKIDGMTVVSPFHSIGFASVFDTETIGSVDVVTAGFGARYGGRLSSVIDLKTRMGNRRDFSAKASVTTFGYGVVAEGPLKKMTEKDPSSISMILSNKGSYIKRSAPVLYPYVDRTGIPFGYNDLFAKVSFVGRRGDQLELSGMHFTDAADYSGHVRSAWKTTGGGVRFLATPTDSRLLFEPSLHYSGYSGEYLEAGKRPRNTRYNTLEASMKVHYKGPVLQLEWGTDLNIISTSHVFVTTGNLYKEDEYFAAEVISYLDTRIETARWLIEPGLRIHYYADQSYVAPEPRLKVKFRVSDLMSFNFASGLYSQNLVSTTSPEDVVNIFQGYYIGPGWVQDSYKGKYIDDKIQLSWHAVAGLSWLTSGNLKMSLEGYVKDYYRMINYNRNKMYDLILNVDSEISHADYLTHYFIIEKGWAYGADVQVDWSTAAWNLYLAYSLGFITREDEFMKYVPHFDRRHNLNLLAGYKWGQRQDWSLRARWNLGSGFPFTQSYGLYENLVLGKGTFAMDPTVSGDLNIWFAPLNQGRLPWFHRLDVSIQKTWLFKGGSSLELTAGVMNAYNRKNVFYVDRLTLERFDQLPVLPTIGLNWRF